MPTPTIRLGVVGWPVAHSRSPAMQNAALAAVGLSDWRYQQLPLPQSLFEETIRALPQAGFRGVNVTIPHKEAALALATTATERARAIGAANTLIFKPDEQIHADNTDAPALIAALPSDPRGKTALVLGAGGSARAVVWALKNAGVERVYVWNRTQERARRLAEELDATATDRAHPAQILVNCTSIGLDDSDDPFKELPVDADGLDKYESVVDLVYSEPDTRLTRAARERSVPVVDGLELLVGQGALSFEQFTGRPAPLEAMRRAVRQAGQRR
jgi:shikimate dehydrogenase